jgi:predicted ATPase
MWALVPDERTEPQVEKPEADDHPEGNVVTRSIVALTSS